MPIYEVFLLSICGCIECTFISERHDSKGNFNKGNIQNESYSASKRQQFSGFGSSRLMRRRQSNLLALRKIIFPELSKTAADILQL
jgi:hypothetical protein